MKTVENLDLSQYSTLRAGGIARVAYFPKDRHELETLMPLNPIIIGFGSNILFKDEIVQRPVVILREFETDIKIEGEKIFAGAGALSTNIARAALDAGITGFEFLTGIPGTIGGAVRGNAGAFGGDMGSVIKSIRSLQFTIHNECCEEKTLSRDEIKFEYRKTDLPTDAVIVSVEMRGTFGDKNAIAEKMKEITEFRATRQPKGFTAGSCFKNPTGDSAGRLLDACGWKGKHLGGAFFSEMHANFLMNDGTATAAELIEIIFAAQQDVFEKTGIKLEPEIKVI